MRARNPPAPPESRKGQLLRYVGPLLFLRAAAGAAGPAARWHVSPSGSSSTAARSLAAEADAAPACTHRSTRRLDRTTGRDRKASRTAHCRIGSDESRAHSPCRKLDDQPGMCDITARRSAPNRDDRGLGASPPGPLAFTPPDRARLNLRRPSAWRPFVGKTVATFSRAPLPRPKPPSPLAARAVQVYAVLGDCQHLGGRTELKQRDVARPVDLRCHPRTREQPVACATI